MILQTCNVYKKCLSRSSWLSRIHQSNYSLHCMSQPPGLFIASTCKGFHKTESTKSRCTGTTHTQLHKDNTARHNKKIIAVTIIKNEKQSVRMSLDTSVFQTTTIQYNWSQCEHFVFKHTNIHYHYICVCCLLVFHLNLGRSRVISCELWYERISLLNHSSCN